MLVNTECWHGTLIMIMYPSLLIWTPLKLVPPGTIFSEIFGPTLKICSTVDQSHEGKSVHVSGHEVTTNNICGVHIEKLNDWLSSVCLGSPYTAFAKKFLKFCDVCRNECSVQFHRE